MKSIALFAIVVSFCVPAFAGPLVDQSSPLETVSTEFAMCDGPAWDGVNTLYVPDVKGGKLYRLTGKGDKLQVVLDDAGRISATFYDHGRLYLSDNGESQIARLKGREKIRLGGQDKNAKPPARPNDLVVDNRRGIYYTLTGQGQVIYLAADGKQTVAVEKIDTPNGLILSPDEKTLYVASYVPKKIWAYDVTAPGKLGPGHEFAAMDTGPEKGADGMTIDRAGNVYCCGPSDIWVWSPGGKLVEKITPPTRPINCAFGGSDMQSLYITGLGGLYRQAMRISGRSPQPPLTSEDQPNDPNKLSTVLPANVTPLFDVPYAQYGDRKLLADIFVPNDRPAPRPTLVIVHGGGWVKGDKVKFRTLALALAARGYVTAAIEYRLAGEAPFPAAIQDCNAAVRFLRAKAQRFNVDPERIGAVGGSAGGHLVGLMAAAPNVAELQGDGGNTGQSSRIAAAVVMAGPMEIATGNVAESSRTGKAFANAFFGGSVDEKQELYELASPIAHFTKDTPPILFQTGELDNPQRDATAIEKLKSLGVWTEQKVYPGGKHGCWNQPAYLPTMVDDIDAFFQQHMK
ncbi:MAG TPA: SMP-30/gluconolactonase/LRE family protein [Pirellulales bacterium]|jgi:acetyl esterase/lipase|nr:SMP-30/gluconolactonase/LRE family protein [Pirellulales bacterium]